MAPAGREGVQYPPSRSVTNVPRTLHALYATDAVRTVEDTLYAIADQSGHGAAIRGALRKVNDLPRYSEQLLQQTWVVWPKAAPQMSSRVSLDRRSTQNEVIVSPAVQNVIMLQRNYASKAWRLEYICISLNQTSLASLCAEN